MEMYNLSLKERRIKSNDTSPKRKPIIKPFAVKFDDKNIHKNAKEKFNSS